jgi:hypothetical protein
MYRVFGQNLGAPSTGFELLCIRSGEWVKVKRDVFNDYYNDICMSSIYPVDSLEFCEEYEEEGSV